MTFVECNATPLEIKEKQLEFVQSDLKYYERKVIEYHKLQEDLITVILEIKEMNK